jgi:hypothetical protein
MYATPKVPPNVGGKPIVGRILNRVIETDLMTQRASTVALGAKKVEDP